MKNFRLLMILVLAFCFSQVTIAQKDCDAIMQKQMQKLQANAAEMSPEEGNKAMARIMKTYNRCMGFDTKAPGDKRGKKNPNKRRRPNVEQPTSNPNIQSSQPLKIVPRERTIRRNENADTRQVPTQNAQQREEQRNIEEAAERGQNPAAAQADQDRMKDYCMRATQEQRERIMRDRDIAVNKISSAVQRRRIYADADKKIRSVLLECMQSMESPE